MELAGRHARTSVVLTAENDMFAKIVIRVFILVCCSHVLKAESLPSLPPDPMNAALLYYQAFLKNTKPDEVIDFLVYDTGLEELDLFFRTGECVAFGELKEEVQRLEANFRRYGVALKETDSLAIAVSKIEDFSKTLDVNEPVYAGPRIQWPDGALPAILSKKHSLSFDLAEYRRQRHLLDTLDDRDLKTIAEQYLDARSDVFELVREASSLPHCDWGYQYSKGSNATYPQSSSIRSLSSLLMAEILKLASEAKVQEAIEYCFMLDKMAIHVGDHTLQSYLGAIGLQGQSLRMIRILLPHIESDAEQLNDLKVSLTRRGPSTLSLAKACKMDLQLALQTVCGNEVLLSRIHKAVELHQLMNNDQNPVPSREALVANASSPLRQYCMKSCEIIEDGKLSFAQKQASLSECADSFEERRRRHQDPSEMIKHPERVLEMAFSLYAPALGRINMLKTRHQAYYNVTLVSIDLLLDRIGEGHFPKMLPEGLPKDPVTGRDLGYNRTQAGFVLSWDKDNLTDMREKYRRFEFEMQEQRPRTAD
jgi:hypothetical protein